MTVVRCTERGGGMGTGASQLLEKRKKKKKGGVDASNCMMQGGISFSSPNIARNECPPFHRQKSADSAKCDALVPCSHWSFASQDDHSASANHIYSK